MPGRPHGRTHAVEQVRHTDEIADDVVAVQPKERRELPQRVHVDEEHGRHQHFDPGEGERRDQEQREEPVEVDPAQVGTQPPPAAQPVGVGHVREEGRPDQVHADADHARPRAAVAAGRRVAALVEQRAGEREADQHEDHRRGGQHHGGAVPRAVPAEHPHVGGDQQGQQQGDRRRPEEHGEHPADPVHGRRGQQSTPAGEQEQRPRPRRRCGAGRRGDQAERHEPVGQQVRDVGGTHHAGAAPPGVLGDRGEVAGAVRRLDDPREQLRQRYDLAVGSAGQKDRTREARPGELAEQCEAVGPAGPEGRHGDVGDLGVGGRSLRRPRGLDHRVSSSPAPVRHPPPAPRRS